MMDSMVASHEGTTSSFERCCQHQELEVRAICHLLDALGYPDYLLENNTDSVPGGYASAASMNVNRNESKWGLN